MIASSSLIIGVPLPTSKWKGGAHPMGKAGGGGGEESISFVSFFVLVCFSFVTFFALVRFSFASN